MQTTTRKGTKVTPGEKRRYDLLRDAGWSPEASAASIGRSKSWAYIYEQEKRGLPRGMSRDPDPNLAVAVELAIAVKEGGDDQGRAFEIYDKYGVGVVPLMAELVFYMATVQAGNTQANLRGMFDGEDDLVAALNAEPMTYQDMLRIIPRNIERVKAGESIADSWEPERAVRWVAILCERYPELAELREEADALEDDPADPYGRIVQLRKRVRDEPEPVAPR